MRAAKPYLQNLGLDPTKWFAVVYWKEPGYHWRKPNATRTIFDAGPYLDAIAHIVAIGGQVVRIGHPTSTVIPQLPGVVDLAKIPDSEGLQLACVPLARFMLASGSGPAAYGSAFGIPTAQTDSTDCYGVWRAQDYILTQGFEFEGEVHRQTKALAHGLLNSGVMHPSAVQIRNTGAELIAAVDEMMAVSANHEPWTPPAIPAPVLGSVTFPQPHDVCSRLLVPPSARIVGKLGG
jgi:putative glycosyltransferase (TIGR04372 family)